MAPQLDTYFKQVDSLSDAFIERLRKAVAIPSVSAEDERRPEVIKVKIYACISQDMLQ
jgi:Cys-Gly metallodipeptidase DUG1